MINYQDTFVSPEDSLITAIKTIDNAGAQIALVVYADHSLLGTITDADIRGVLLKGISLSDTKCLEVMNRTPLTLTVDSHGSERVAIMEKHHIRQLPLVDNDIVLGMSVIEELHIQRQRPNAVLIMAGGLGSRLGDLTKKCPKPMLTVGEQPLLETTIKRMSEQGFKRFFVSVNYLAHKITNYFGDGSKFGVSIEYIPEEKAMGTAGALAMFPYEEEHSIIVMNGDIFTMLDFGLMVDYHKLYKPACTVALKKHPVTVPYGVMDIASENIITGIIEKPTYDFFISAGIYVFSPEIVKFLTKNEYIDMPSVFSQLLNSGKKLISYPLHELWLDIGTPADLTTANSICLTI